MDAYSLHLAMAALFGASFVAVSAYYMHRKTLNQLLEFAKSIEKDKEYGEDEDLLQHYKKQNIDKPSRRSNSRRNGSYRRTSTSLPNVTAVTGGHDDDCIPVGLPKLQTLPKGKATRHKGLAKRASLILRQTSPKSPVASVSAFESIEGSDEDDDVTDNVNLDATYLHTNGNAGPECASVNANGEQMPAAATTMIRSHSVSGDLHGVQPDPVAADILRKEPEHETFVRLKITPYGKLK